MDHYKYQSDEVGNVLRKLRNEKMVTQQEVSDAIGMYKTTYHNTEKGKREMSLPEMFAIAHYFGLKPTALLEMIQTSPAELSEIKKLRLKVDELLQQNAYLKAQIQEEINKIA